MSLGLLACGELPGDKKTETDKNTEASTPTKNEAIQVAQDLPADSTGAKADISLSFNSQLPTSLALAEVASSQDLGNGIVLNDVRLNIKSIKLKASKEKSEEEESFRDVLKLKKKEFEKEIEDQKKAIEVKKEGIEKKYKPQMEGASTEEEKNAVKELMKQEEAAIEKEKADLEKMKDEKEEQFEYEFDKNIKWKGPYVYDALKATITPEIPSIKLVDGSYKRVEFKVKPNREAAADDTLLNNSVVVSGSIEIDQQAVPFMVSMQMSEEFRLMGAGAFTVDADSQENPLAIAFNVPGWFTSVDLASGLVGTDGVISINEISNKPLYDVIKKNIKASTKFGKDEDGDGKLEDDELEGDGEEGAEELELEDDEDEKKEKEESESSSEEESQDDEQTEEQE